MAPSLHRIIAIGLLVASPTVGATASPSLTPLDPSQFLFSPNRAATVSFATNATRPLTYEIKNYQGHMIGRFKARINTSGDAVAHLRLPVGYYTLQFKTLKQAFGVDVIPKFQGHPDPFFCTDAAMSWTVVQSIYPHFASVRIAMIKGLRRNGIAMARERLGWGQPAPELNPSPGTWHWQTPRQYDALRRDYHRLGIPVLELFHTSPAYLGHIGLFPNNLIGTVRAWTTIANRWRHDWGALEIWNEPNIGGGGRVPPDQDVPLIAALSWSLHKQYPHLLIGGPTLAESAPSYFTYAAHNGLLNAIDFFSFHCYDRSLTYEQHLIRQYRHLLAKFGHPNMPIWITESGRPWHKSLWGLAHRPQMLPGQVSALGIVMQGIEARVCGVRRFFPFVYPYEQEGPQQLRFGMLGLDATPERSFAAYSQAIAALAHSRYIGNLQCNDPTIKQARVFARGKQTVAVIYTGHPDVNASVRLPFAVQRALGIDGRTLTLTKGGRIPVPDGMTYVYAHRSAVFAHLNRHTPAMRLYRSTTGNQKPLALGPIVFQFIPGTHSVKLAIAGYTLKSTSHLSSVPLKVRVNNLDDNSHRVTVSLKYVSRTGSQPALAPSRTMTVLPHTFRDLTYHVNLSTAHFLRNDRLRICVQGIDREVSHILPLSIELAVPDKSHR